MEYDPVYLRNYYRQLLPKLEARREQLDRVIRRQKRRMQQVEYERQQFALSCKWSQAWVHPRKAYPIDSYASLHIVEDPQAERGKLDISLPDLYKTALYLFRRKGDRAAAATLRVIGNVPKRFKRHKEVSRMPASFAKMLHENSFTDEISVAASVEEKQFLRQSA